MYYPSWSTYNADFQIADIDISKLTHISYSFIDVVDGRCTYGDKYADYEKFFPSTDDWDDYNGKMRGNFNQLFQSKKKHPHLKTMMTVGGREVTSFSTIASTERKREKFAQSCADFMQQHKFDGIDLAWEYPAAKDKHNFVLLLKALRKAMDALGDQHPLSIVASAERDTSAGYLMSEINDIVDFVNVQTYDFSTAFDSETGHNAPLYSNPDAVAGSSSVDEAIRLFLALGLAKQKLILGLPLYGHSWRQVTANGLFQFSRGPAEGTWDKGTVNYNDLVDNYINKNGYTRYYDNLSKVPYLYNPEAQVFISYDDEESICHKVGYVMKHDLGGAMAWDVSGDSGGILQGLAYDVVVAGADACYVD